MKGDGMLVAAILKAGIGKSDALSGLIKRLIFSDVEPGIEIVSAYMLIGSFDAMIVISAIDEDIARHFISKVESVLGSRALIHVASPIKP
ncbi:MAG: hypothetical protein HXX80_01220 [Nitrososphaerales archaeon]|nr:hypothetical protein [Nitrososphaerales archaeon]